MEPQAALDCLTVIMEGMNRKITEYIVAQESHEDGNLHLHCYLQVDKKVDITVPSKLNIKEEEKEFHGNFQGVKSDTAVIKYCTKGGKYISSKEIEEL